MKLDGQSRRTNSKSAYQHSLSILFGAFGNGEYAFIAQLTV